MTTKSKKILYGIIALLIATSIVGYIRYNKHQKTVIPTEIRTPKDLDKLGEQSQRVEDEAKANAEAAEKQ